MPKSVEIANFVMRVLFGLELPAILWVFRLHTPQAVQIIDAENKQMILLPNHSRPVVVNANVDLGVDVLDMVHHLGASYDPARALDIISTSASIFATLRYYLYRTRHDPERLQGWHLSAFRVPAAEYRMGWTVFHQLSREEKKRLDRSIYRLVRRQDWPSRNLEVLVKRARRTTFSVSLLQLLPPLNSIPEARRKAAIKLMHVVADGHKFYKNPGTAAGRHSTKTVPEERQLHPGVSDRIAAHWAQNLRASDFNFFFDQLNVQGQFARGNGDVDDIADLGTSALTVYPIETLYERFGSRAATEREFQRAEQLIEARAFASRDIRDQTFRNQAN
ncbi:hypothetical protein OIV83_004357 [Microbotryomycetes sp. JL201]|nr:hypothetical protein OIV83_004268 [Microbotryomycetes sp. JL201]KAK4049208.1 hypothetical protein OIV83_004357 [Microbotryomycetes sp. JL201]